MEFRAQSNGTAVAGDTSASAGSGKTLLLACSIPGDRDVGQIVLRQMLGCVKPETFVVAALLSPAAAAEVMAADGIRIFTVPNEHSIRRFSGRLGNLGAAIERLSSYERAIASLAKEVLAYARDNNVTRIWAVLNATSAIDTCVRVVKHMQVPLLAHVWDDVDHIARQRGLDRLTVYRTKHRFGRILAKADRTAVIGETMAAEYATRYGARCKIVRLGISDSVIPHESPTSNEEFVIGFSGSMYCPSAWKALELALARLGWMVGGKRIRFLITGSQMNFATRSPVHVEYLGWRSDEDVHERLSACDLLYLPQPFEPSQRELAKLSFPTKLSAYVGTGRPVLVHAPAYASLPVFARTHPLGHVCCSLDPVDVAAAIETLACDAQRYGEASRASASIANTVLSKANFTAQVRAFLGEDLA